MTGGSQVRRGDVTKRGAGRCASTGAATLGLAVAGLVALPLPARALPPLVLPITVTTTADAGAGSLRQAIITANASVGPDTIVFGIAAAGVQVIAPVTDLDPITDPVTIDGYTQPGAAPAGPGGNAVMMVVIDAAGLSHGLDVATDDSVVKGLVVQNASAGTGTGIKVSGDSNVVSGNYLGTTDSGLQAAGNSGVGLDVRGDGNVVGGSTAADRNVISANSDGGVLIDGDDNTVAGNRIGTRDTGLGALGNGLIAVEVRGDGNVIGGDLGAERNVISDSTTGVKVSEGAGNRLLGNRIGTDVTGTVALGNVVGVLVDAGSTDVVGNLVSGNLDDGLKIQAKSSVVENRIGTTASGAAALPNGQEGISVDAPNTVIGMPGRGNLVSGNGGDGIAIWFGADDTVVQGNTIGTTAAGAPLGNGDDGIDSDAAAVTIQGNVVSANAGRGLGVVGDGSVVQGNTIGAGAGAAAALGNATEGVDILGDGSRVVRNRIALNGSDGVRISGGTGIAVLSNGISDNGGLGIDLGPDDVTPNDAGDVDAGANDLLNVPTLPVATTVNGVTTVDWKISDGLRASTQRLEFFGQPSCDASGNGEGLTPLGSVVATTDAVFGTVSGQTQLAASVPVGQVVVATATVQGPAPVSAVGPTSEFSACAVVT
jgi:hypothetical protein